MTQKCEHDHQEGACDHEEPEEEIDEDYIERAVAPKVSEIDLMKREESAILSDINEEVEGLRRQAASHDDDEY